MEFSRQEYWSELPFPSPGELPNPGIQPGSPVLQVDFFTVWASREALILVVTNKTLLVTPVSNTISPFPYFLQLREWSQVCLFSSFRASTRLIYFVYVLSQVLVCWRLKKKLLWYVPVLPDISKLTKGMTHKWIISLQLADWLGFQNKRQNWFELIVLDSVFSMCALGEVIERTWLPAGPHEMDPGNWELLTLFPGEGNGNPLQYSCLENLMDRGA